MIKDVRPDTMGGAGGGNLPILVSKKKKKLRAIQNKQTNDLNYL